jgi:hypothetical protein
MVAINECLSLKMAAKIRTSWLSWFDTKERVEAEGGRPK